MKKIILGVAAVLAVVTGLYFAGIIKIPGGGGGGAAGNFLDDAQKMMPANTQAFLAYPSSDLWTDQIKDVTIEAALSAIPQEDLAKIKQVIGEDLTPEFIKSFTDVNVAAAAWPKEGASLVDAAKAFKDDHVTVGAVLYLRYKGGKSLDELIQKIQKNNPDKKVEMTTESFEGGNLYTVQDKPAVSFFVKDRELMIGLDKSDIQDVVKRAQSGGDSFSQNALFKKATQQIKSATQNIVFVDLKSNIASAVKEGGKDFETAPPEIKSLVNSVEYLYADSWLDKSKNTVASHMVIHVDAAQAGPIGEILFSAKEHTNFGSPSVVSDKNTLLVALDLLTIWNDVHDVMGAVPSLAPMQDMLAMRLQSMGVDLQKDIIDALTGEIAFTVDMKKMYEGLYSAQSDPANPMASVQNAYSTAGLFIGVKNQDTLQQLLMKVGGPFVMGAQTSTYKSATISALPSMGAYAFVKGFLVVGASEDAIKSAIDAMEAGNVLSKKSVLAGDMGISKQHSYLMAYYDMRAVMDAVMQAMPQLDKMAQAQGASPDPKMEQTMKILELEKKILNEIRFEMGTSPEGIVFDSVMNLQASGS